MSTENKKKVLVGFGAFAVGLIAILAIWRPPAFRSEDASGSIGTVQKYHAPQITPQDVVLGNETTRREQQIRYADFLNDAAKLHALSAKITASNFEAASAEMDAMRADSRQRFAAVATEALAQAQTLARNDSAAAKGITELSAVLQNGHLSDADMVNVGTKLGALAARFGVTTAADRAKTASQEVASAVAEMRSNRADAAVKMDNATGELKALNVVSLADEVQYLSVTAMESKAIAKSQEELKMMNASTSLAAAYNKNMGGVSAARELLAQADVLESKAAKAMENQLGLLVVIASAFRDIDANLAAARGIVANEASAAARGGQAYDKAFANLAQAFAGTKVEFNAHANAGINAELAALNSYFANERQAGVKAASGHDMENVLAMLSEKLAGSTALAASLAGREKLVAQAHELSQRARN